jgi:hypothetical protein
VPAGSVEHQDDDAVAPGAGLAGEGGQHPFEEPLVDAVGEIPDRLPARRGDEGDEVEPLEAVMAERQRARAFRRPDPAPHRLQAEPVLVGGPELDWLVGVVSGFLREGLGEFF